MFNEMILSCVAFVIIVGIILVCMSDDYQKQEWKEQQVWEKYVDDFVVEFDWEYTLCFLEKNSFLRTLTTDEVKKYRQRITDILRERNKGAMNYDLGATSRLKAIRAQLDELLTTP